MTTGLPRRVGPTAAWQRGINSEFLGSGDLGQWLLASLALVIGSDDLGDK